MLLLSTVRAVLPGGNPRRHYLGALLLLPARPTHRNLDCFGGHCPHTYGRQAARACDFAALSLAGLCEVISYKHGLTLASDSPFLLKSGWRWHGGEGG